MKYIIFSEQNGVPNGFIICKGSIIGKTLAKLAQLFYNNFRPRWAEVSEKIRPMMGLITWAATSSQIGTKLKSLANLARLLTEAGLLTCGQLGHKLKNGAQVDHKLK